MKKYIMTLVSLILSSQAFAGAALSDERNLTIKFGSTYTDLKTDCIDVSVPTADAEIDFYDADCKAFGGYRLQITGSDLRYHPRLFFGAKEVALPEVLSFHDTGSQKIEWVYRLQRAEEGGGSIEWKGLIYRLNQASGDGEKDTSVLYAIRLDGTKSCLIGTTQSNTKARELVINSKPGCK